MWETKPDWRVFKTEQRAERNYRQKVYPALSGVWWLSRRVGVNGLGKQRGRSASDTLGLSGHEFKVRSVSRVVYFPPATYISLHGVAKS